MDKWLNMVKVVDVSYLMNEDVFVCIVPGDETISTLHIEPLYLTSYSAGNCGGKELALEN